MTIPNHTSSRNDHEWYTRYICTKAILAEAATCSVNRSCDFKMTSQIVHQSQTGKHCLVSDKYPD